MNGKSESEPPRPLRWRGKVIGLLVVFAASGWLVWNLRPSTTNTQVEIPALSVVAANGRAIFAENCAACHGTSAAGGDTGPPLIHIIYNPRHHADGAFYGAAKLGVLQHHWRFGNMPAQPQVSDDEIAAVVQYVRELQRANGIN